MPKCCQGISFSLIKNFLLKWRTVSKCEFDGNQKYSPFLNDGCTESQLQQMPGHSHQLLILFQHFRLSDFDCHLFHTKDFKARHKCLLNFIWLISLKSIFVTSKDSTCCSPRQNYSELIWRRNEACWISTITLQCDWNSVIFIAGN